jgi:hypothetical protein
MRTLFQLVGRLYGSAVLCFFAFAPGWVGFNILLQILLKPSELDLTAIIAMAVCFALLYFLLLLAYRAFTGQGRKSDGGLLPPWAMKFFIGAYGAFGILIVIFGAYSGKVIAVLGGLADVSSAVAIYGLLKWRQSQHRIDA